MRRRGEDGEVLGMCLGMTECWIRGPMPSRQTRERPNLCRLLCSFAQKELPGFHFTSIQVNKDYAAELHVDKKDAGDSRIIGLGPYRGGQLWVDDGSHGGKGRVANVKGRWLGFDGNLPHKVLPFTGRRYTLVFFSKLRGWNVGLDPCSKHGKMLRDLGFPLPMREPTVKNLMHSSELLLRAKKRYEAFAARSLQRGAGRTLRLHLEAPGAAFAAHVSSASPMAALKAAFGEVTKATRATKVTKEEEVGEEIEVKMASLPLLPTDSFGRLGVSQRAFCTVDSAAKRQRTMGPSLTC